MRISRLEPTPSPQASSRLKDVDGRRERKEELLYLIRRRQTRGPRLVQAVAELLEDHLLEDLAEYRAVSACLTERKQPEQALAVWDELRFIGQTPEVKDYMQAMKAATKCRKWEVAMDILEELRSNGHPESVEAFMQAIMAAKEGKQWELAVHLLNSMPDAGITPDAGIYNVVLGACDRSRNWPAAETVYEDMRHWGVVPDRITYNTLMSAASWGEKGYLRALDFHAEMKDKMPRRDVKATTTIITACSRWSRWELAVDLLAEGKRDFVSPTVRTYDAVLAGCPDDAWEAVLKLFGEMQRFEQLKPDLWALNKALGACQAGGLWEEALHILAGMKEFTDALPDEVYEKAISTCKQCQEEDVAEELRSEMETKPEVEPWVVQKINR